MSVLSCRRSTVTGVPSHSQVKIVEGSTTHLANLLVLEFQRNEFREKINEIKQGEEVALQYSSKSTFVEEKEARVHVKTTIERWWEERFGIVWYLHATRGAVPKWSVVQPRKKYDAYSEKFSEAEQGEAYITLADLTMRVEEAVQAIIAKIDWVSGDFLWGKITQVESHRLR